MATASSKQSNTEIQRHRLDRRSFDCHFPAEVRQLRKWQRPVQNNRIQKFSATGSTGVPSTVTYLLKFGNYGNGNGQFKTIEYRNSAPPARQAFLRLSLTC